LYVAMTRARDALYLTYPQRYYRRPRGLEDPHSYAQVSRFLTPDVLAHCDVHGPSAPPDLAEVRVDGIAEVDAFLAGLWSD
jgi:hypothetical protein